MTRPLAFSPTAAAPLNPAALNSAALNSAALNPSPLNPAFSGVGGASPAQGITDALPLHDVNDRPIGELLKESVSLSAEQSAAIAKHMRANGIRYGEAAVALGLVSRDQVLQALARQFRYPFANPEARHRLGSELVVLNQPFTHAAEASLLTACASGGVGLLLARRQSAREIKAAIGPGSVTLALQF